MSKKRNKTEVTRLTSTEKELIEQIRFTSTTTSKERIVYETIKEPIWYEEGKSRVLVIGDTHEPFSIDGYLDHCKEVYNTFQCDTVVHIGDEVDNHFASYHDTDPDGFGAGEELDRAVYRLNKYYEAFPNATVIIGNHTSMAYRKALSGGLSKDWIREYSDVLEVPNWEFVYETDIDGVTYHHGLGGTARTKMKNEASSYVQGHYHTQAYIEFLATKQQMLFAMQVGCGIDHKAYAMAYAKSGKKPVISCGVVLNGDKPFLIPMKL